MSSRAVIAVVDVVSTGALLERALADANFEVIVVSSSDDFKATARLLRDRDAMMVIAGSEAGVNRANNLSHALGTPHHRFELGLARRDKAAMVDALLRAGMPTARTYAALHIEDLDQIINTAPFPLFVKPVSSAGSDGCFVVEDATALRSAYHNTVTRLNFLGEPNSGLVVQEVLVGPQYIVHTVSAGGIHILTDVHLVRVDNVIGHPILRDWVLLNELDDDADRVVRYTLASLSALGIENGAAHSEVRLTLAGPRLIEVNARIMGGSLNPEYYRRALGYNQIDVVIETSIEPKAFAARAERPYHAHAALATVVLSVPTRGMVLDIGGLDRITTLTSFAGFERVAEIGDIVDPMGVSSGTAGLAFLLHPDPAVLQRDLAQLHAWEDEDVLIARSQL